MWLHLGTGTYPCYELQSPTTRSLTSCFGYAKACTGFAALFADRNGSLLSLLLLQDQVAQVKHQLKDMQHRAQEQAQHISMLRTPQSQQAELLSAAPNTAQPILMQQQQKLQEAHPVLAPAASSGMVM